MRDLKELRVEIDRIDREVVALFEERMGISKEVAEYKIATGKKILDKERENIRYGKLDATDAQVEAAARAVLADPRIFVLDEATSSIDTQTEQLIQQAIDHLLQDRTSFLIAHRLSTIRKADMILVVRDGRIVEQGTHQELLRRHGYYHDLYSKQFAEESAARILQ